MKNCLSIYLTIAVLSLAASCHMTIPEDHFNIRNKIVSGDSLHIYSTIDEPISNNFSENKTYYSVRFGKVRTLQGGIDGEPLQGVYELFLKKKLIVKGSFRSGLKQGKWFEWFPNGKLRSITNFQAGVAQGEYKEFDEEGNIRFDGKFSRGQLNGIAKIINGEQSQSVKYRDGVLMDSLNAEKKLFKWVKGKKSDEEE